MSKPWQCRICTATTTNLTCSGTRWNPHTPTRKEIEDYGELWDAAVEGMGPLREGEETEGEIMRDGRELRYSPADTNDYVQCPYCHVVAGDVKQLASHLKGKHDLNQPSQRV
jgi:hypothetical protein